MLMGDFLKTENANLVWFHEIQIVFVYGRIGCGFYRLFVIWEGGVKFLLLFGFLGLNLGYMPWIFPLASYK